MDDHVEDCPELMEEECPVMWGKQKEPCVGCRWLHPNPNYKPIALFFELPLDHNNGR